MFKIAEIMGLEIQPGQEASVVHMPANELVHALINAHFGRPVE
jgi:hypothetical protein